MNALTDFFAELGDDWNIDHDGEEEEWYGDDWYGDGGWYEEEYWNQDWSASGSGTSPEAADQPPPGTQFRAPETAQAPGASGGKATGTVQAITRAGALPGPQGSPTSEPTL